MFFWKQDKDQLQDLQNLVITMRDDLMRLERKINVLENRNTEAAPYGYTKEGTPRRKPGRKSSVKR